MSQYQPLHDQVLLQPDNSETAARTSGGLYIPAIAQKERNTGTVVAIGSGNTIEGKVEMEVKVGDRVLFRQGAGIEVEHNGATMLLIPEPMILAKVTDA